MKKLDLTGQTFHLWTVLKEARTPPGGKGSWWKCRCRCGTRRDISGSSLNSGASRSCGCVAQKDAGTALHSAWIDVKRKCTCPKHRAYPQFGGAGVTLCHRWTLAFAFFRDDMGPRPFPGAPVEIIDRAKPWGPGNCRWGKTRAVRKSRKQLQPAAQ
jgi:hypothetical protein